MTISPRNRRGGRAVRGCLVGLAVVLLAACGEEGSEQAAAARAPLTAAADHRAIERAERVLARRCLAREGVARPVTRHEGRIHAGLHRTCAGRARKRIYGDPLEHRAIVQARNEGRRLDAYAAHIRAAAGRARRLT